MAHVRFGEGAGHCEGGVHRGYCGGLAEFKVFRCMALLWNVDVPDQRFFARVFVEASLYSLCLRHVNIDRKSDAPRTSSLVAPVRGASPEKIKPEVLRLCQLRYPQRAAVPPSTVACPPPCVGSGTARWKRASTPGRHAWFTSGGPSRTLEPPMVAGLRRSRQRWAGKGREREEEGSRGALRLGFVYDGRRIAAVLEILQKASGI